MRGWLIGCGTVLVIGIGVAVFFGNMVYKQFKSSATQIDEAATSFQQLEQDFPFHKKEGQVLTKDQLDRFIACRQEVLAVVELHMDQWKDEETSMIDKFTLGMGIAPALARSHAGALQKNGMSPAEYFWIMNQILVVLRYGESSEAPAGIKELRQAFENPPRKGANDLGSEENMESFITESKSQVVIELLPQIEPWQIRITEETVQAMLERSDALAETMAAFYYYDLHFKNTFSVVHDHHEDGEVAPPPSGAVEGAANDAENPR